MARPPGADEFNPHLRLFSMIHGGWGLGAMGAGTGSPGGGEGERDRDRTKTLAAQQRRNPGAAISPSAAPPSAILCALCASAFLFFNAEAQRTQSPAEKWGGGGEISGRGKMVGVLCQSGDWRSQGASAFLFLTQRRRERKAPQRSWGGGEISGRGKMVGVLCQSGDWRSQGASAVLFLTQRRRERRDPQRTIDSRKRAR